MLICVVDWKSRGAFSFPNHLITSTPLVQAKEARAGRMGLQPLDASGHETDI